RAADIGNSRVSPWMCVWQSHAPAGTSKLTGVAGCAAFAMARRGASAAAPAASRNSRRSIMAPSSELVAPQPAVHGNHRAGDVARARRGEEADQVCNVLRLAVLADGNLFLALLL